MAKSLYCWRCRADQPTLDEQEWSRVNAALNNSVEQIKGYRQSHGASLTEARRQDYGRDALNCYFQITGYHEADAGVLWHHRLSLFGAPCRVCGKPLRTPRACFCAACGAKA